MAGHTWLGCECGLAGLLTGPEKFWLLVLRLGDLRGCVLKGSNGWAMSLRDEDPGFRDRSPLEGGKEGGTRLVGSPRLKRKSAVLACVAMCDVCAISSGAMCVSILDAVERRRCLMRL